MKRGITVIMLLLMAFVLVFTVSAGGRGEEAPPTEPDEPAETAAPAAEVPGPDYLQLDITTPELYLGEIFGYGWEGSAEVYKVHVFSRLLWLDNTGKVTGGDLVTELVAWTHTVGAHHFMRRERRSHEHIGTVFTGRPRRNVRDLVRVPVEHSY